MRAAIVTIVLATSARAFVAPAPKTSALRAPRTGVEQHLGPTDVLAALPSVPALPAGTGAVAGELGVYALKTAISWGVPAAVVALVAFPLISAARGDKEDRAPPGVTDFGDEFALGDDGMGGGGLPFGGPKKRKVANRKTSPEFLKVERLNSRLESFDFSLTAATSGRLAAKRARRETRLRGAFGDELGLAELSDDDFLKLQVAEGKYLAERADARAEAALYRAQLRGKAPAAVGEQSNATKNSTGNVLRRLAKNPFGKNGDRQAALEKVEDATRRELEAELDYLDAVKTALPSDAARLRLGQLAATTAGDESIAGLGGALAFARDGEAGARAFVLDFDGDVQASQLANLREEVTAVLGFANATRGDEVVLKLNSGGGTVTGYGLAAAQLMRVKDAGFKLTVCIEQVAASGGYMMACVGDRIVASPFAVLGSIGVISDIPNVYERLKKEGIEFQTVTAGAYKRTLTPTKKVTKEDMDKSKQDIKEIFTLFKTFVAGQRPALDIDAVATGETWFGEDALKRRLCDELRTFDDVCLDYYHQGTDVLKVTYAKPPATPLAALLQTADAPAGPSAAAAVAQLAKAALPLLADLAAAADAGDANLRRPMALDDDLINRFKAQDLL